MTERRRGLVDMATVLVAGGVSMLGSAASFVAVPWYVLSTTGSAARTGLVSAAAGGGAVVSGLVSGPLMDRIGHRRVAVVADLVAAVMIAGVPWLGGTPLWAVAGLVCAAAAAGMASSTARQSMLSGLSARAGVPLSRASALYWLLQRAALVCAAVPAALVIAGLGPVTVLWADAATFLLAAGVLGLRRMPGDGGSPGRRRFSHGWAFIRDDRFITLVLATAVLLTALEAPLVTLIIPLLTASTGPESLGHLVLAYAAGMLAGAATLAVVADRVPRRTVAVSCLALVGVGYTGLVALPSSWWVVVLTVMGLATGPLAPLIVSSVQRRTPAAMVGQVTGALLALVMAAVPLGRAGSGVAIQAAGLDSVLIICAAAYLGTMTFLALSRRSAQVLGSYRGT